MIEDNKVVLRLIPGEAEWLAAGLVFASDRADEESLRDYQRWREKMGGVIREQAQELRDAARRRLYKQGAQPVGE